MPFYFSRHLVTALLLLFAIVAPTRSQVIVRKDKPGQTHWSVSHNRRYSPDDFSELHSIHKSAGAASVAADELRDIASRNNNGGDWDITKILIEGDPAASGPVAIGPQIPEWSPVTAQFERDLDRRLRRVFRRNLAGLTAAFARAREGAAFLLSPTTGVDAISRQKFAEVNALIGEFNSQVKNLQAGDDGAAFQGFNKIVFIDEDDVQAADEWREALREQFDMEEDYTGLAEEQDELIHERAGLIAEKKNLQRLENDLKQLQNRATEVTLAGRTASGTWTHNGKTDRVAYQFFAGNRLRYSSPTENLQGTYSVTGNRIRMQMGNTTQDGTITGDTISMGTLTSGRSRGHETIVVAGLSNQIAQALQPKRQELSRRRSQRQSRLQTYRTRLNSYNQRVQSYHARSQTAQRRMGSLPFHRSGSRPLVPPHIRSRNQ